MEGVSGEQFALPRAVERLREVRRTPADGRIFTISAADPLNLTGIVTHDERVRAAARSRLAYRDGVAIAVQEGHVFRPLAPLDAALATDAAIALRRRTLTGDAAVYPGVHAGAAVPTATTAGLRTAATAGRGVPRNGVRH